MKRQKAGNGDSFPAFLLRFIRRKYVKARCFYEEFQFYR